MQNYASMVRQAGVGATPRFCQDAMVELLEELFQGKKFLGQEGRKELKVYKQNLPIQKRGRDQTVDTEAAAAPYIIVEMDEGAILDDNSPQVMDFNLILCAYDRGTEREGAQDVTNIKEDIVQCICARPWFGGVFTILKPITWAFQQEDTWPYYYGVVSFSCTAPAMTQETELEGLV